jgi:hypothetical protein
MRKPLPFLPPSALLAGLSLAAAAVAAATGGAAVADDHPSPRLKLAERTFSIGNVDSTPLPVGGLELDLYPLSARWLRGGITAAAGKGQGEMSGSDVSLHYGLLGVSGGVQYPARVTPFVEGNLSGGLLEGSLDSALAVPGTSLSISGGSAVTWIYGRGVDVGAELYTVGRLYVSGAIGWVRTTWHGPDLAAMAEAPAAGFVFRDYTADSVTFKLGLGI